MLNVSHLCRRLANAFERTKLDGHRSVVVVETKVELNVVAPPVPFRLSFPGYRSRLIVTVVVEWRVFVLSSTVHKLGLK